METRRLLLDELLGVQAEVGIDLISGLEIRLIREQWTQDEATAVMRKLADASSNEELVETLPNT